jgi:hypothetical protein
LCDRLHPPPSLLLKGTAARDRSDSAAVPIETKEEFFAAWGFISRLGQRGLLSLRNDSVLAVRGLRHRSRTPLTPTSGRLVGPPLFRIRTNIASHCSSFRYGELARPAHEIEIRALSRGRLIAFEPVYHRFCLVGFRSRTPGPPPFSSMNWMPPFSKADCIRCTVASALKRGVLGDGGSRRTRASFLRPRNRELRVHAHHWHDLLVVCMR